MGKYVVGNKNTEARNVVTYLQGKPAVDMKVVLYKQAL